VQLDLLVELDLREQLEPLESLDPLALMARHTLLIILMVALQQSIPTSFTMQELQ
jgi:hypothetical protein